MKEHVLLWKAVNALKIDIPILSYEILGPDEIQLNLYGGRVVSFTNTLDAAALESLGAPPEKKKTRARKGTR